MNDWQWTWLGRRSLPRDLSGFEIEAFFNCSNAERRVIDERRGPALKIALALPIGFLRMTGRLVQRIRMIFLDARQLMPKDFTNAAVRPWCPSPPIPPPTAPPRAQLT